MVIMSAELCTGLVGPRVFTPLEYYLEVSNRQDKKETKQNQHQRLTRRQLVGARTPVQIFETSSNMEQSNSDSEDQTRCHNNGLKP